MHASAAAHAGAGDAAPANLGMTIKDEPVLLKDYGGKVVVVSFWASWCPYCLKELPILFNIQKAAKGAVQVVAINTEDDETFDRLAYILRTIEIGMAYDPDGKARAAFGVKGIPHLAIIGRDGKIVEVFRGYSEASLQPIIDAINGAIAAQ